MALAAHAILPKLAGWPLLVAPGAAKIEPINTLRSLEGSAGSSPLRGGNRTGRWSIPETSEILGDVPSGSLVSLVFQKTKRDVFVIMIS